MKKETSKHCIFTLFSRKKYTKVVMRSKGEECTGITMNGNKEETDEQQGKME